MSLFDKMKRGERLPAMGGTGSRRYMNFYTATAGEGRVLELEGISRSLKSLARELHVPLLVASQVGRTVTSRDNKRAQMSDSLGSGAFERDADLWITLHRESYYQELDTPPDFEVAEVIVRKNRNGPTGRVTVGWQRKTVQFVDLINEGGRV